jgi:hypothetical protein
VPAHFRPRGPRADRRNAGSSERPSALGQQERKQDGPRARCVSAPNATRPVPPLDGVSFRNLSGKATPQARPAPLSPAISCASKVVQIPLTGLRHLGASPEQEPLVRKWFAASSCPPWRNPARKKSLASYLSAVDPISFRKNRLIPTSPQPVLEPQGNARRMALKRRWAGKIPRFSQAPASRALAQRRPV